jgi:hypothetical protein
MNGKMKKNIVFDDEKRGEIISDEATQCTWIARGLRRSLMAAAIDAAQSRMHPRSTPLTLFFFIR